MHLHRRRERGISLIEALVAMVVMAFGTLAVLGVQTSLRINADLSRQRTEAVRIAQETLEVARSYHTVQEYEDDIAAAGPDEVTGYDQSNTVFSVETRIEDAHGAEADPRRKTVTVIVSWEDRTGQAQSVQLNSAVHRVPPALAGGIIVPANVSPVATPGGRHVAIPPEALDQGDGTSKFAPPGAPDGVRWTFNNVSGVITRLCDTCDPVNALLMSGFVRYAVTAAQPTGSDAELPPSTADFVAITVAQTAPTAVPAPTCYSRLSTAFVTYYCAVQTTTGTWSGRSTLVPSASLVLASDAATDKRADRRRVCRYTPVVAGCDAVVGTTAATTTRIWGFPNVAMTCSAPSPQTTPPTPGRLMTNADHPDTYVNVNGPLLNQNFLVIAAGSAVLGPGFSDGVVFTCPGDDTSTPFINGNTRRHQP